MDVKKMLEMAVEHGHYQKLGELYGAYIVESDIMKFPGAKENFQDFIEVIDRLKEKYSFNNDTTLQEVLEKLN